MPSSPTQQGSVNRSFRAIRDVERFDNLGSVERRRTEYGTLREEDVPEASLDRLRGTSCVPRIVRCCPLSISCRGAVAHRGAGLAAPQQLYDVLDGLGQIDDSDDVDVGDEAQAGVLASQRWRTALDCRSHARRTLVKGQFAAVDGFRFLCMCLVMLHAAAFGVELSRRSEGTFPNALVANASIGPCPGQSALLGDGDSVFGSLSNLMINAADMGFNGLLCISGFLNAIRLVVEYRERAELRACEFWNRRVCRLVPVAVLVFFLSLGISEGGAHTATCWVPGTIWMMVVLAAAYMVIPFLILCIFAGNVGWRLPLLLAATFDPVARGIILTSHKMFRETTLHLARSLLKASSQEAGLSLSGLQQHQLLFDKSRRRRPRGRDGNSASRSMTLTPPLSPQQTRRTPCSSHSWCSSSSPKRRSAARRQ